MHSNTLSVTAACPRPWRFIKNVASTFSIVCLLAVTFFSPSAQAAEAGTITGAVSNAQTGNMLEGARIEVPALKLSWHLRSRRELYRSR
jgi:hypothetical protein